MILELLPDYLRISPNVGCMVRSVNSECLRAHGAANLPENDLAIISTAASDFDFLKCKQLENILAEIKVDLERCSGLLSHH